MYRLTKLIDGIGEFAPARDMWAGESSRGGVDVVTVTFTGGRTGRLDLTDPLAAHWADVIQRVADAKGLVYVEIDDESGVITEVLIPRLFTVEALETVASGDVRVRLHQSHAIHGLLRSDPNFEAMRDSLQAALDDGSERLITSTRDDLEIVDVRTPGTGSSGPGGVPVPPAPDPPVSPARATDIFDDMNSESCAACNPDSTCITFLFPDDGCWIRAHLMAYQMKAYTPPEDPEKAYITGSLHPFVPNHPDCQLPWGWGWHIAPTLMVSLPGGDERRVIDPSLASGPVSEADWVNMNNPSGPHTLAIVPWTTYNPVLNNAATEAQAQLDMQDYRDLLKSRCLQFGPPPYSCLKSLFFILDRNTISDDEVEAMLLSGSPARISDAFYVVLDGYSPAELGFTSATMQQQPTLSVSPGVGSMTLTADRIEFEYPGHLNRRQRLTWVYHIDFTGTSDFTAPRRTITVQASMSAEAGSGTLYLIQQQNPYEIDGSVSWLSTDLRVFQVNSGETRFGVTMASDPNSFITQVITKLNDNTAGQTFDSISTDQQTSRLELSSTVGGQPVYNFAVAKVRYRSKDSNANHVRVFFRLFPWATTSVEYSQATEYRRYQSGNRVVPLLGRKNDAVSSIPCFASPRIDSATASMTTQKDTPNVQTIHKDTSGAEVSQYFGCWLDINQPLQEHFPFQLPATNKDGPFTNRKSIQDHIRNEHQCLVSEIAFLPAPAQNGTTPSKSDKLAQRNLAIVETNNPGVSLSRRIPQTFEVQPSLSTVDHDELMIDWGNVPAGSMATVYLPGIDTREMVTLASRKYRHHRLKRIDGHTVKFETGGISYLPIPFTDAALPGLLTVDLPEGVKHGQVFTVVVRQVTGVRRQLDPRRLVREELADWRHIVGSFQLTIPVRDKATILPHQEHLLSVLRWIGRAIPSEDRWSRVFARYVSQIADRVDALGGDSRRVAPSPSGEWRAAYRVCLAMTVLATLLSGALLIGAGTVAGVLLGAVLGVGTAVIAWVIAYWRRRCRPTSCQMIGALLGGAGLAALVLIALAALGFGSTQLAIVLIGSLVIGLLAAIRLWRRGCFGGK